MRDYFRRPKNAGNLAKVLLLSFLLFALTLNFSAGYVYSQTQSDGLTRSLDNLARDISQSLDSSITSASGPDQAIAKAADQILGKLEDISFSDVKTFIESVNTPEQIKYVVETVRTFASSNKKLPYNIASIKTLKLLNEKTRFLIAQSPDNQQYFELTNQINALNKELNLQKSSLFKAYAGDKKSAGENAAVQAEAVNTAVSESVNENAERSSAKVLLGANYDETAQATTFGLNAPRATSVKLIVFDSAKATSGTEYEMKKNADGIWSTSIKQNLVGKFYQYSVDGPKGPGERFDAEKLVSDPYAYANDGSAGKSIVVDRNFKWEDAGFKTPLAKDAIIYEMHVKDYTAHVSSGVSKDKSGKYLGLLEGQTSDKVLGHLKQLGVTAVELLPVHEFDNQAAPSGVNHWGYMTTHFMAPESSYASGSYGQQVNEFKKLVNGLHKNGIAVILDVVYNHTAEGNEQGPVYNFKGIDNKSYYRLYNDPNCYWNGTGCGNEFRTDSELGRKYVLDTLMFWVKEYHIDGFRFDLATIIDKDTMMAINNTLPANVLLIAEPWAADWNRNQWTKGDFRETKWAKWNDDFKNAVKGFICGKGNRDNMMTVIAGTCYWWTAKPTESINFVECHDNATIMDFCGNNQKIAMLGGFAVLTSQGTPMLHEGQEFLKNKRGNDNSYDQDNDINYINWELKEKNKSAFEFFSGLVKIRKTFSQFRHDKPLGEGEIKWILVSNTNGIGYQLFGKSEDIIVLMNGDQNNWVSFPMPDDKDWTILCNGEKVDLNGKLGTCKGDYKVPPVTGVILMRKK